MSCFVGEEVMPYLFLAVFRYFAERIATTSITFKKQGQETKHHYSNQRRLSGKGKPFTELVHESMLCAAAFVAGSLALEDEAEHADRS